MNDDRWLETLREEYRPEPLSPSRAVDFRRTLEERIHDRRDARRLAPAALAAAVVSALALWLSWPVAAPLPADTSATNAELESFVNPDRFANEVAERPDYLPADYQGLALLLDEDSADR